MSEPKMSQLELTKQQWEAARVIPIQINLKLEAISRQLKDLKLRLRQAPNQSETNSIDFQLRELENQYQAEVNRLEVANLEAARLEIAYHNMLSRVESAQRTLALLANPPAWGLGDYSPADLKKIEERSLRIVNELTQ